jgi:PTS system nitrogen regulatory IIA component
MPGTSADEILTIKQLSEYLMVSEKTIYRMLERNSLPALRVGGQWRFRRKDIDAWIDNQVRKVEMEGDRNVLVDLKHSEINLTPLIEEENVWLDVPPISRDELLTWMVMKAKIEEEVDRDALAASIRTREQICSTALVDHAAFPHSDDPAKFRLSRKRVLIAVLREPANFQDPHGHQPRVVVMILARSVRGYLLTISRAIKLFGDSRLVDTLSRCKGPAEVIAAIREAENPLQVREQ